MLKRVPLAGGWTLWPHVLVRGAGFPLAEVLALADEPVWEAALDGGPAFELAWARASVTRKAALRTVAAAPRFREAVLWQNRGAVENGLDVLLRREPGQDDKRTRQKEQLVVSYLQRYTAKCDTIGFFGPVGWGRWGAHPRVLRQAPGPSLLAARSVHFEPWGLQALVDGVLRDDAAAVELPLVLPGDLGVVRGRLVGLDPTEADTIERRILTQVDGRRTARQVAKKAGVEPAQALALVRRGLALPALRVAIEAHPEGRLEAAARRLREPARKAFVGALAAMTTAKDAVERAAGDPEALGVALASLDRTFEEVSGFAATRNEGRTYGGRTLVYEECRRAGEVELGEALLSSLAAPLSLWLDLARAFCGRVAQAAVRAVDRSLGSRRSAPLGELWRDTAGLFDGSPPTFIAREVARLQAAVAKAAAIEPGAREVRLDSTTLRTRLARLLAQPKEAWPGAVHQAPDLMLARQGGDFIPVLSELHAGVTPFSTLSVLAHCPVRDELAALYVEDVAQPWVTPIPWEDFARSTHDARLAPQTKRWHVDLGFRFGSPLPRARVQKVAELTLKRTARGLLVTSRDGRLEAPLLHVLERRIKLRAANEFSPLAWSAHRPRVWVDGLVVAREAWRLDALQFAGGGDEKSRYRLACAAARGLGLPRFVFARSPRETIPIFVDFASPALVELLCRQARGAPSVIVTEMLPGPDALWLEDAEGRRYVSELRMVAVAPPHRQKKT